MINEFFFDFLPQKISILSDASLPIGKGDSGRSGESSSTKYVSARKRFDQCNKGRIMHTHTHTHHTQTQTHTHAHVHTHTHHTHAHAHTHTHTHPHTHTHTHSLTHTPHTDKHIRKKERALSNHENGSWSWRRECAGVWERDPQCERDQSRQHCRLRRY